MHVQLWKKYENGSDGTFGSSTPMLRRGLRRWTNLARAQKKVEKTRLKLYQWSFMSWLDPHINHRNTKTNLEDDTEDEDENENVYVDNDDDLDLEDEDEDDSMTENPGI